MLRKDFQYGEEWASCKLSYQRVFTLLNLHLRYTVVTEFFYHGGCIAMWCTVKGVCCATKKNRRCYVLCKRCAVRHCVMLNDLRPCNADYNWKYPTGRQAGRQAGRQSPALHFHGNQDSPPVWMCQGCVFIMHTQSANRAQYHHYITCGIKCIGLGRIYPVRSANEVPSRIPMSGTDFCIPRNETAGPRYFQT